MTTLRGQCHCGSVAVEIPDDSFGVVACHCGDCQKLHGNFFAMLTSDANAVRFAGEEHIEWYASSASSQRGFCRRCGSRIAKRPVEGSRMMLSAGLFQADLPRKLKKNVWARSKPVWYELPPEDAGHVAGVRMTSEEFVALALSAPIENGPAKYGYAMRLASGNRKPPGVVALTWIQGANEAERERIRAHSRENVKDFLAEPGFISIVTGFTGLRGFTVTAWEDEASMKRALSKHHAVAMKELLSENFVGSVWTSVWAPTRINRTWLRCPPCGSLEDVSDDHRACSKCDATLPERPELW